VCKITETFSAKNLSRIGLWQQHSFTRFYKQNKTPKKTTTKKKYGVRESSQSLDASFCSAATGA
jgi:hypothetical protein